MLMTLVYVTWMNSSKRTHKRQIQLERKSHNRHTHLGYYNMKNINTEKRLFHYHILHTGTITGGS